MTTEPRIAPSITIRPAAADDVPTLVEMVNAAYRASEGHVFPGTTRVQRTDAMKRLDGMVVAIVDGAVAGCVRYELGGHDCAVPEQSDHDARIAHFGLLSTDIGLQGRGIASRLIEHVERTARDAGCTLMRIEVVKEGGRVPFYERRGYVVTAETDGQIWNGGQDWGAAGAWHMVDMEKPL
jgi:GNAT superfamily N-acetyltransferase